MSIENDPNTCGVAHVCRLGGYQYARFGGSCRNAGVMVHELGHTLCFGHEQSRADRDNYLSYPCGSSDGIDQGFNLLGLFYDYKSCMHYGCNDCMKPKMTDVDTSMCGGDMSVLDVEKFNAFYDCGGAVRDSKLIIRTLSAFIILKNSFRLYGLPFSTSINTDIH